MLKVLYLVDLYIAYFICDVIAYVIFSAGVVIGVIGDICTYLTI